MNESLFTDTSKWTACVLEAIPPPPSPIPPNVNDGSLVEFNHVDILCQFRNEEESRTPGSSGVRRDGVGEGRGV